MRLYNQNGGTFQNGEIRCSKVVPLQMYLIYHNVPHDRNKHLHYLIWTKGSIAIHLIFDYKMPTKNRKFVCWQYEIYKQNGDTVQKGEIRCSTMVPVVIAQFTTMYFMNQRYR